MGFEEYMSCKRFGQSFPEALQHGYDSTAGFECVARSSGVIKIGSAKYALRASTASRKRRAWGKIRFTQSA
jgi:hypothetical protein